MNLRKLLFILSSLVLASCNYTKLKQPAEDLNGKFSLPQEEMEKLSYSYVFSKVFEPKCISCHGDSGGVNLESFARIVEKIPQIKQTVFIDQTMPKKAALSEEQKKILWNWIAMGAPQWPSDPNSPEEPDPLLATFDSINNKIFIPKCVSCHSAGEAAQNILLSKEDLLNSPYELVIPNNPDESGLVIAIERDDDKRMPPAKEGFAALKNEEKIAIRKWIENGATD